MDKCPDLHLCTVAWTRPRWYAYTFFSSDSRGHPPLGTNRGTPTNTATLYITGTNPHTSSPPHRTRTHYFLPGTHNAAHQQTCAHSTVSTTNTRNHGPLTETPTSPFRHTPKASRGSSVQNLTHKSKMWAGHPEQENTLAGARNESSMDDKPLHLETGEATPQGHKTL